MTLFDHRRREIQDRIAPLATRMRPRNLDEFVGQKHILAPGMVLRRAIEDDRVPSMILWGPPGSGKTTLARLIAGATDSHFEQLSAVSSGVKEVRAVMAAANDRLGQTGRRTILFIDEIHRFSKSQQEIPGVFRQRHPVASKAVVHVRNGPIDNLGDVIVIERFESVDPGT